MENAIISKGLRYYSRDVDIVSDPKIKQVMRKYRSFGLAVIDRFLDRIFNNGYYLSWNDYENMEAAAIADEIYEYDRIDDINDILMILLSNGFFSKEMFKMYGIVTSHGVQKRYVNACQRNRRQSIIIKKEYSLLDDDSNDNKNTVNEKPKRQEIVIPLEEKAIINSDVTDITDEQKNNDHKDLVESVINCYVEKLGDVLSVPRLPLIESDIVAIKQRDKDLQKLELSWSDLFDKVRGSPFLCGSNDRGWRASLRFIINKRNMRKILDGDYVQNRSYNNRNSNGPSYKPDKKQSDLFGNSGF